MAPVTPLPLTSAEKKKIEPYLEDWHTKTKDERTKIRNDLATEFLKERQRDTEDGYAKAWMVTVCTQ